MARPREFQEDVAVEAAMNVFWEHGYGGASIALLLEGMGMTKGSLYKAFTDKKSLFLIAIARYEAAQVLPAVTILCDASVPDGRDRLRDLFGNIGKAVRQGDARGCLMCSAAAGPSFDDAEIATIVHGLLHQMRRAFAEALGTFMAEEDSARLARVLLTQYIGLRILARSQVSAEELELSVAALLDGLDWAAL